MRSFLEPELPLGARSTCETALAIVGGKLFAGDETQPVTPVIVITKIVFSRLENNSRKRKTPKRSLIGSMADFDNGHWSRV